MSGKQQQQQDQAGQDHIIIISIVPLGASWFHSEDLDYDVMATMVPRRDLLKVVRVHQVDKDAILVCYGNVMQVVTLQGNPKQHKKMVSQLNFDFNVDSIGG